MSERLREFDYIDWLRRHVDPHPAVPVGIGDDAAVLRIAPPGECLVTTDMLMEGVDFVFPPATPRAAGRKSLAVSLSDIAAMAGRPLAAVVSVAFSRGSGRSFAEAFHAGVREAAREFSVAIAGGDTNSWDGPLVVSTTVLGEPTGAGPVRRSGARPGDWILVTGDLGGSLAGRHLSFRPRVDEAQSLHKAIALHAMIDVSDGLAADLHHVLQASAAGAVVRASAIPISEAARCADDGRTALTHALGDGEDFELLFTTSAEDGRRILANPPFATRIAHIGEVIAGRDCLIINEDGSRSTLEPAGWVHEI